MKKYKHTINIRISEEELDALNLIRTRYNKSVSSLIRKSISYYAYNYLK